MECKGFLFDLDGTLVSSLPVVERLWTELALRLGADPAEAMDFIHGKQAITSLRHFMQGRSEEDIQKEFVWLEQKEATDTEGVTALPGAIALLNRLNELSIPWAIVTSGSIPVAYARADASHLPRPEVFITAEQVARGKPEPDAYLLGAKSLGFEPHECIVVEDARAGIQSGLSAGCQVIAVNAPLDTPELPQVNLSLNSLEQLLIRREENKIYVTQQ